MFKRIIILLVILMAMVALPVSAHDEGDPIHDDEETGVDSEFDIVFAQVTRAGSNLLFQIVVVGEAGAKIPEAIGAVANAEVFSYVWVTSLDTSLVGFDAEQGILALAVTSHPDFDDTPLWDENNDGDLTNDGATWHSHWVVLVADEACGEGGLKVRDIAEGETPSVPDTWPQLPILISSPNYDLDLFESDVVVTVPHSDLDYVESFNFDGVTAGLRVNGNLHNPFLCVFGVNDIASNDLSLTGTMGR